MPDKAKEPKKGGLRGIFNKRKDSTPQAPTPSAAAEDNHGKEQNARPTTKRTYTPRYAERDMILSVPVEDRPDLVAKAKEARLKRTCSDIGFSTESSSSQSFSSHSRAASLNLRDLSMHPNLRLNRRTAGDLASSASSSSSLDGLRGPMLRRPPLSQSASTSDLMWRGLSYSGSPHIPTRPHPRTSQSLANVPQMIPESQQEQLGHGLDNVDVSSGYHEDGSGADNVSRASTPSSGDVSRRQAAAHVTTRQRLYFSHKGPLPNLRAGKEGKGKGKATEQDWQDGGYRQHGSSRDDSGYPSQRGSYESIPNYFSSVRTQGGPNHTVPAPPSNSDSSQFGSPNASADRRKESGPPSVTESDTTDHSWSYNNGSPRTSSVSTMMTQHTGPEEDTSGAKTKSAVREDDADDGEDSLATPNAEHQPELHKVQSAQTANKISLEA